jgi:Fe-S-cluster containining protein
LVKDDQTEVACNACTECCKSKQALLLHPGLGDDLESYQFRTAAHPDTGDPVFLLAVKENGECVYLGSSGCTIYDRRPLLCRSFDCRKHYLILPRQDRDNLVRVGVSSRAIFDAGRSRAKTLSQAERKECLDKRKEFFS